MSEPYLVFEVCGAEYALPLVGVVEIVPLGPFGPARHTHQPLEGVVSVRGEPVPVADLAVVFQEQRQAIGPESCALIAMASKGGRPAHVGLAVDAVRRVITLAASEIAPAPRIGPVVEIELFSGIANVERQLVPILDLRRLLDTEEVRAAQGTGPVPATEPRPESAP